MSLFPTEPDANPLQDWLDSCAKLEALLPPETLVLPSHNEPFRGVKLRLQELIDGHETGLEKLLALCAEPQAGGRLFSRRCSGHGSQPETTSWRREKASRI